MNFKAILYRIFDRKTHRLVVLGASYEKRRTFVSLLQTNAPRLVNGRTIYWCVIKFKSQGASAITLLIEILVLRIDLQYYFIFLNPSEIV